MESEKQNNNDIILWKAVSKSNRLAFDNLYRKHVQLLYNYGVKLGANPELVKDCIQDLFADLWRKRTQLKIEKSIKNYLLLSLRRLIFKKLEKIKALPLEEDSTSQLIDDSEKILENATSDLAKIQKIKQSLALLPKRQREAIFLKYFENLSYEETAKIMSIQVGAVYKLVSAGIKKLRQIL